ncbi:MAG: PD-(D/E)XK nuclease family protein [Defluviitaleaceae bacterium]|nr:PD-(D/E)XK nuclease family protein [Defluviitaleaceae bacterium]
MALQFILGKPGTGKTTYALDEIHKNTAQNAPLYYLVPEQFSLQSEKLLLEKDYTASIKVQVLSFNRLAYRLFSALGAPEGKHADDLAKQMLLRKALFETADELEFFKSAADKLGFIAELASTITEMNHYMVNASDLLDRAAGAKPSTAAKLRDTALILTKYREIVSGQYLLTDDMLEILCRKLSDVPSSQALPLLDGAFFWVDGFSGFTPQEVAVLVHILKRADMVKMTLTINDIISPAPRETMEKLETAAAAAGVKTLPHVHMERNFRHKNKQLAFFAENFGANLTFEHDSEGIEIIAASDKYSSVYAVAERVLQLVRGGNYRFRDIAILCGDRASYEKILQTVFDRLNIPIFIDTEIDILAHPLTEMVRAVLEIPLRNRDYESVFRFLKTRLTTVQDIDVLENYVLANGIHSYRWNYQFSDEAAEAARQEFLNAIKDFAKLRPDSSATVEAHARRVFDMLFALGVPEALQEWFERSMKDGDPATARLHAQIWPKICQVFDKLVEVLGGERVTLKTFAAVLDVGLCQVGLGRIPPTNDQIILGDCTRTRYPKIKAMLVLGANDGVLPPIPTQSGIFTEHERKSLQNTELSLAPNSSHRISEQNYNLYCAVSQPSEKLIFIYAEEKSLRPAPIIAQVKKMFPKTAVRTAKIPEEFSVSHSVFFAPFALSRDTTDKLYGNTIYTAATRLEAFARCPFAYYMNYILKARPRKLYEVLPADLGKFFHDVIAGFTQRVWSGAGDSPSRAEINGIVDEMVGSLELENSIFYSTARNMYILDKVRRVAAASCWALCEQVKSDSYRPLLIEHEIKTTIALDNARSLILSGRADRIDISQESGRVKIIDYKSGNTKFNTAEVLKGVQLQLMLYMNAFLRMERTFEPGGVFYFPIDDPIINADTVLDEASREQSLLKCFKMSGLEADEAKAAFLEFGGEVEGKVRELGARIFDGDIAARPYVRGAGQGGACRYCGFGGVCGTTNARS